MFSISFPTFLNTDSLAKHFLWVPGDFNFHFGNVENNNSRKLHDIIDMFNLTQSISEPTHNQGRLLDLVFSKQSDNILTSTKLHHGLTSDHSHLVQTRCICTPTKTRNFLALSASKSSVSDYSTISVPSLTSSPLCRRTVRTRKLRRRPGTAVSPSSSLTETGASLGGETMAQI